MYHGSVTIAAGRYVHAIGFKGVRLLPIGGDVSWGHLGQSSYNAALTILTHAFANRKRAERLAHRFKREILSEMYYDRPWCFSKDEVMRWAEGRSHGMFVAKEHIS